MPAWKLTIEYQGTRYHGWQEQKNARTVAGVIRAAAMDLFGSPVELGGAGRTDAGVHALAQVAHLRAARKLSSIEVEIGLNSRLPADVNVLRVDDARPGFDARRDAVCRYYLYQIATRRTAFAKQYVWWVKDRLDVDTMQDAAKLLAGRHDFREFSEKQSDDKSTIVVVESAGVQREGDLILFRVAASHFLWKMVRRIVGTLVEVGRGRVAAAQFEALLTPPKRNAERLPANHNPSLNVAAYTAPSSGLFLERVCYKEEDRPGQLRPALAVDPLE